MSIKLDHLAEQLERFRDDHLTKILNRRLKHSFQYEYHDYFNRFFVERKKILPGSLLTRMPIGSSTILAYSGIGLFTSDLPWDPTFNFGSSTTSCFICTNKSTITVLAIKTLDQAISRKFDFNTIKQRHVYDFMYWFLTPRARLEWSWFVFSSLLSIDRDCVDMIFFNTLRLVEIALDRAYDVLVLDPSRGVCTTSTMTIIKHMRIVNEEHERR